MDLNRLLIPALRAAVLAGREIMDVYGTDFTVTLKSDATPLTLADQRAHAVITRELAPLGIPLLSEEGRDIPYAERRAWDTLWIIDPLDGTKEFIGRNGEFTVNIALVQHQIPVLGVIFIPAKAHLYFSTPEGAFRLSDTTLLGEITQNTPAPALHRILAGSQPLPIMAPPESPYIILGSRSHATPELDRFVADEKDKGRNVRLVSAGSALKFCLMAEGAASLYPRFGATMEWDTAAGQAIAAASGARIYRYDTGGPLLYNRENLVNPSFVVEGVKINHAHPHKL